MSIVNDRDTDTKEEEAIISPSTIASIVMGHDASRSRVFADPSQGKMTGDTAVAVKKRVIPTSPATRNATGMPAPHQEGEEQEDRHEYPEDEHGTLEVIDADVFFGNCPCPPELCQRILPGS